MVDFEFEKCKQMAAAIRAQIAISNALFDAFCTTPRTPFAPMASIAFSLDAQPIAANQWISSPLTVAKMTQALELDARDIVAKGGASVLEIGCGSGYQAAILSKLARRVFTIERIEKLAIAAKERLAALRYNNVFVRYDDGNHGWQSCAPFDRILFSCACDGEVPPRVLDQLAVGGVLVAPVRLATRDSYGKAGAREVILQIKKRERNIGGLFGKEFFYDKRELGACEFVPLRSGVERVGDETKTPWLGRTSGGSGNGGSGGSGGAKIEQRYGKWLK